ncbi:unnamed protein product [Amoebophrya sp. A120]|nr:unnamed protein product [Amoebophrya sp. A120]|eukprot:GSA120T00020360001.1
MGRAPENFGPAVEVAPVVVLKMKNFLSPVRVEDSDSDFSSPGGCASSRRVGGASSSGTEEAGLGSGNHLREGGSSSAGAAAVFGFSSSAGTKPFARRGNGLLLTHGPGPLYTAKGRMRNYLPLLQEEHPSDQQDQRAATLEVVQPTAGGGGDHRVVTPFPPQLARDDTGTSATGRKDSLAGSGSEDAGPIKSKEKRDVEQPANQTHEANCARSRREDVVEVASDSGIRVMTGTPHEVDSCAFPIVTNETVTKMNNRNATLASTRRSPSL